MILYQYSGKGKVKATCHLHTHRSRIHVSQARCVVPGVARQFHQLYRVLYVRQGRSSLRREMGPRDAERGSRETLCGLGTRGPGNASGVCIVEVGCPCTFDSHFMTQCVEESSRWAIHMVISLPFSVSDRVALLGDAVGVAVSFQGVTDKCATKDARNGDPSRSWRRPIH